ncbi:copper transporter [Tsukamurella sp. 8F]|uniref:copper transporter n=1 Tax=unclassified Tsukamurella TaxID=2633480 RepID=UPI0023BA241E|nr:MULTISPECIES: copper transporter [unclassified Tsukamurella]MDF0532232.1 copper transporter [Tsukamurella sp. 8J]MDF0588063.1 copper transporter [Tsukamurella sp. 8F]
MPGLKRPSARRPALFWAALLVALAVGLALGGGVLSRFTGDGGVTSSLHDQVDRLEAENSALKSRAAAGDGYAEATSAALLAGRLKGVPVVVVRAADADSGDVTAVSDRIKQAGGDVTGTLTLTRTLYADGQAERLRGVADQVAPEGTTLKGADPAARAGDLLGALLLAKQGAQAPSAGERRDALAALRDGGFVTYDGDNVAPGRIAVVVSGGGVDAAGGSEGQAVGRLASAISAHGAGAVLAGRTGSADGGGPIPVVRGDGALTRSLSTVDDVDTAVGRVATALALASAADGRYGAYGTGKGASGVAPTVK